MTKAEIEKDLRMEEEVKSRRRYNERMRISRDLRILDIQFYYGDSMSRAEYAGKKQKLENKLEKIKGGE